MLQRVLVEGNYADFVLLSSGFSHFNPFALTVLYRIRFVLRLYSAVVFAT
jgi:hypothetical protein